MKTLALLVFSTLFCSSAFTQKDTINVTLKAKHHAYIVAFTPKDGNVEKVRYINQVSQKLNIDTAGKIVDSAQLITVNVSTDLVRELYLVIGSQQERLTTNYNADIKLELLPQLQRKPLLLAAIAAIGAKNATETEQMVDLGFKYLAAIKQ